MPTRETIKRLLEKGFPATVIGELGVSHAQGAFQNQKIGNIEWPARYEGLKGPQLNIAGALADLKVSTRVKGRRFEERKAGFDRGDLFRSIAPRELTDGVEWGSADPKAAGFQLGLEVDRTPVVGVVRRNLARAVQSGVKRTLNKEGKKEVRDRVKLVLAGRDATKNQKSAVKRRVTNGVLQNQRFRDKDKERREGQLFEFRSLLGPLFTSDKGKTQLHARPFVLTTGSEERIEPEDLRQDILESLELYYNNPRG